MDLKMMRRRRMYFKISVRRARRIENVIRRIAIERVLYRILRVSVESAISIGGFMGY